jgi:Phosphate transport (Pho88)
MRTIIHFWTDLVVVLVLVVQVELTVIGATTTSTWMLPRPLLQHHNNIHHCRSSIRNRWCNDFSFPWVRQQRQEYRLLILLSRGGDASGAPSESINEAEEDDTEEEVSDTVEADSGNGSLDVVTKTEEEGDDVDTDDDNEEEEEEDVDAVQESDESDITDKSNSIQKYDDPYVPNSMSNMYISIVVMILGRKVDLLSPTMVRITRFIFITYIVLHLGFLTYVRIQAKQINNRTTIQLPTNPLISSLINNQLGGGGTDTSSSSSSESGTNSMIKSLASSFLSSSTTVFEYDLKQSRNMQNGLLFNMLFMWFLHFKMGQVQPLLINTFNGIISMVYSPLFQVYILGRNLERPFQIQATPKPTNANSTETDDGATAATETFDEDDDDDESSNDNTEDPTELEGDDDDDDDDVE